MHVGQLLADGFVLGRLLLLQLGDCGLLVNDASLPVSQRLGDLAVMRKALMQLDRRRRDGSDSEAEDGEQRPRRQAQRPHAAERRQHDDLHRINGPKGTLPSLAPAKPSGYGSSPQADSACSWAL